MLIDRRGGGVGYRTGAVVLVLVALLAYASTKFSPESAESGTTASAPDDAPGCSVPAEVVAPAAFASHPDPRGISTRHVFDRLVEFDRRSGRIVSGLATGWEVSADRRTYTFRLRTGVQFQSAPGFTPTRPFSAADVVFTFNRLMEPGHPLHRIPDAGNGDFERTGFADLITDVYAAGDGTANFVLRVPDPGFLAGLTMDFASILSAEYAKAMRKNGTPERFAAWPVGTGPFALAATDGGEVRYRAHPGYWGDRLPGAVAGPVPERVIPPATTGID